MNDFASEKKPEIKCINTLNVYLVIFRNNYLIIFIIYTDNFE